LGDTVILGAGMTGLTAAYALQRHGCPVQVLEKSRAVGGASRTVRWQEFRFDLGGHRLYSRDPEVLGLVRELLGDEVLTVQRISRIYLRRRFVDYPLSFFNALGALGPLTSLAVGLSYVCEKANGIFRERSIKTFEDWVVSQFGRKLYEIYFKGYSEKVWGVPCTELSADFAGQRIKGMSLWEALKGMFRMNGQRPDSLVGEFLYPRLGFGRIPETMAQALPSDRVRLSASVVRVVHDGTRVRAACVKDGSTERRYDADYVISTIPVSDLVEMMDPPLPEDVREAARGLRYRDMIIMFLALDRERVTQDHWIYFPDPDTSFGRIHEPKNWSPAMAPPDKTGLVVEEFCQQHEPIWDEPDEVLLERAARQLEELGLIEASEVAGGCVTRLPKAYPLYCNSYRESLSTVFGCLRRFDNLQCAGRNGLFRYTSGDRYIEMGLKAARKVLGLPDSDVDAVAIEQEYAEQ